MKKLLSSLKITKEDFLMQKTRRYTKQDVVNNVFYQLPKFLFYEEFKDLSNDSRVLYSLLKDRHELSLSNGWLNDSGEVYFIFTRDNMGEILGLSKKTVIKTINELKKYGLIEEERQGQGKPNLIFLRAISVDMPMKCKKSTSRSVKDTPLEIEDLHPNNTNINNTDNNQLVSSTDEQTNEAIQKVIEQSQVDLYEDESNKDTIKEIIADTYKDTSTRAIITKLKIEHIDMAIDRYRKAQEEKDIKNPKLYFKKCLLSAIQESGLKGLF